jgi:outer membrane protein assembly factor BamD (BamD/ComL family)
MASGNPRTVSEAAGLRVARGAALLCLCLLGGCSWDQLNPFTLPAPPAGNGASFVLQPDGLHEEMPDGEKDPIRDQLRWAHELFRQERYSEAERIYDHIASRKRYAPELVQEAMYYRAECLRLQGQYPKAVDVYSSLLEKFNHLHTPYREQAVRHIYDIANYWLDDTRAEMKAAEAGKGDIAWANFVHFQRSKPLLDEEGRAVQALERVNMYDPTGPLAAHALFLCGAVNLYRENYEEADHYFTRIYKQHNKSDLTAKAVELAIFAKQMSTGGPDYDGRRVAEARELVQAAFTYDELARHKKDFLMRQLVGINLQQAAKDYSQAEFYRRTGHEPSAYFYYEMVRRRYPGTRYAKQATQRMNEIRNQMAANGRPAPDGPADHPAKPEAGGGESVIQPVAEVKKPEAPPPPARREPPAELPPLPNMQGPSG